METTILKANSVLPQCKSLILVAHLVSTTPTLNVHSSKKGWNQREKKKLAQNSVKEEEYQEDNLCMFKYGF